VDVSIEKTLGGFNMAEDCEDYEIVDCENCEGTGAIRCESCNGYGYQSEDKNSPLNDIRCNFCDLSPGRYNSFSGDKCRVCNGLGEVCLGCDALWEH